MVTWGVDQTLLFDKTQPPVQIGKNNNANTTLTPTAGGKRRKKTRSRKQTRRKQTRRIKR